MLVSHLHKVNPSLGPHLPCGDAELQRREKKERERVCGRSGRLSNPSLAMCSATARQYLHSSQLSVSIPKTFERSDPHSTVLRLSL